ncbi:MAG: hypothetical protein ACT4PQ_09075 [Betaproteobacteria bacterium]
MRAFISILAVAGLFAVPLPSHGDDASDRQIDGGPVEPSAATKKAGRAIDDAAGEAGGLTYDPTMGGRATFIDDGAVKSGGAKAKPGQAADDPNVTQTNKKKSKKAKTPAPVPTN